MAKEKFSGKKRPQSPRAKDGKKKRTKKKITKADLAAAFREIEKKTRPQAVTHKGEKLNEWTEEQMQACVNEYWEDRVNPPKDRKKRSIRWVAEKHFPDRKGHYYGTVRRRIRKLVLGFKHASGRPSTSKADQQVDVDIDLDEIENELDEDPYQDEAEGEGEDLHARQQQDSALRMQHLGVAGARLFVGLEDVRNIVSKEQQEENQDKPEKRTDTVETQQPYEDEDCVLVPISDLFLRSRGINELELASAEADQDITFLKVGKGKGVGKGKAKGRGSGRMTRTQAKHLQQMKEVLATKLPDQTDWEVVEVKEAVRNHARQLVSRFTQRVINTDEMPNITMFCPPHVQQKIRQLVDSAKTGPERCEEVRPCSSGTGTEQTQQKDDRKAAIKELADRKATEVICKIEKKKRVNQLLQQTDMDQEETDELNSLLLECSEPRVEEGEEQSDTKDLEDLMEASAGILALQVDCSTGETSVPIQQTTPACQVRIVAQLLLDMFS